MYVYYVIYSPCHDNSLTNFFIVKYVATFPFNLKLFWLKCLRIATLPPALYLNLFTISCVIAFKVFIGCPTLLAFVHKIHNGTC